MEERITNLEARVQHLEENKNDVNTIVAVISNKLDNIIQSIDKLSLSQEKNISDLSAKYDKLEEKYERLKEEINARTDGKDAEKWQKIVLTICTGIVGVVIGLMFK
jgi:outer membrane murein-binding lipoprotein Lpp